VGSFLLNARQLALHVGERRRCERCPLRHDAAPQSSTPRRSAWVCNSWAGERSFLLTASPFAGHVASCAADVLTARSLRCPSRLVSYGLTTTRCDKAWHILFRLPADQGRLVGRLDTLGAAHDLLPA
jgi:hypothetical protein